jgi:hypothetical protein
LDCDNFADFQLGLDFSDHDNHFQATRIPQQQFTVPFSSLSPLPPEWSWFLPAAHHHHQFPSNPASTNDVEMSDEMEM